MSTKIIKVRKLDIPRNNHSTKAKNTEFKFPKNHELVLRGASRYPHPKLREMQRYNTCCVKKHKIIEDIYNDKAVILEQNDEKVKALVRYSSRYYVVIFDKKIKKIKTFLPDNIENLLDYVQELMDKENSRILELAA